LLQLYFRSSRLCPSSYRFKQWWQSGNYKKKGGELFYKKEEIITLVNKVFSNINNYKSNIEKFSITDVAEQYMQSIKQTLNLKPQKISYFFLLKILLILNLFIIINKNLSTPNFSRYFKKVKKSFSLRI